MNLIPSLGVKVSVYMTFLFGGKENIAKGNFAINSSQSLVNLVNEGLPGDY